MSTPKIPSKPIKPLASDCCGSGCDRCVFDIYQDQMRAYNDWLDRHPETACLLLDEDDNESTSKRTHIKLNVRKQSKGKPYSPFD